MLRQHTVPGHANIDTGRNNTCNIRCAYLLFNQNVCLGYAYLILWLRTNGQFRSHHTFVFAGLKQPCQNSCGSVFWLSGSFWAVPNPYFFVKRSVGRCPHFKFHRCNNILTYDHEYPVVQIQFIPIVRAWDCSKSICSWGGRLRRGSMNFHSCCLQESDDSYYDTNRF